MPKKPNQLRLDALKELKRAQKAITEGRKELEAANVKIALAQSMIDHSAKVLRDSWSERRR